MKRLYEPMAYGPEPIQNGYWQSTIDPLDLPTMQGTRRTDVAIIGWGAYRVTRPFTNDEIERAGWTSDQMAFDSRNLLHYFRLMPNRRFLFGMRGGIFATPRAEAKIKQLLRRLHIMTTAPQWRAIAARFLLILSRTSRRACPPQAFCKPFQRSFLLVSNAAGFSPQHMR